MKYRGSHLKPMCPLWHRPCPGSVKPGASPWTVHLELGERSNLQLGTWSGKQRSLKLLISLAEILKSNMNFWAETNQHKEKSLKDHPLISGLNWSTLGKPKSVCKTQMVYLWKEIITRTFQMVWSELSWEIQAVCNTVPLAGHDFHYKWHNGAGFPGCTKFGESDELHTSVVVALDPTAQSL